MLLWPRTCSRDLLPGRPYRLPNSTPVVCACAQAPLTHPGPPPPFPENVSFAVCACAREPTRLARTTAARGPAPALLAVVAAVCACARDPRRPRSLRGGRRCRRAQDDDEEDGAAGRSPAPKDLEPQVAASGPGGCAQHLQETRGRGRRPAARQSGVVWRRRGVRWRPCRPAARWTQPGRESSCGPCPAWIPETRRLESRGVLRENWPLVGVGRVPGTSPPRGLGVSGKKKRPRAP